MIETAPYPAPPTMRRIVGNALAEGARERAIRDDQPGAYPAPPTMRSVVAALVDQDLRS